MIATLAHTQRRLLLTLAQRGAGNWALLVVLFMLLAPAGCTRPVSDQLISNMRLAKHLPPPAPAPEAPLPTVEELEGALASKVASPDAAGNSQVEAVDGWYLAVAATHEYLLPTGEYRWRHAALDRWLEHEPAARLEPALKSSEPWIVAAATIGLARSEPAQHNRRLLQLIANAGQSEALRCAAIETLARDPSFETEAELRKLVDKYGPSEQAPADTPLYVELLSGLARHIPIDQEPLFAKALTLDDPQVQVAVLALYKAQRTKHLPPEVLPLATSPSSQVRQAALAALATAQHPDAVRLLTAATQDDDVQVRIAAIERLGEVEHPAAALALHDLATDGAERLREAAAGALVQQHEWRAVERAARDPSFRVRGAVATALAKHGHADRAPLARQLLTDHSAIVQSKMAAALADWPLDLAGPLLIESLRSPNLLTRESAAQSLQTQWPAAKEFQPREPDNERREAAVERLSAQWRQERPTVTLQPAEESPGSLPTAEVLRLVELYQNGDAQERWLAKRQLEKLGADALPALDELVATQRLALDEAAYRDLLPAISPAFATIEELRAMDVTTRRTAARQLAQQATAEPLSALAIDRLSTVARAESDALVWQDVLRAATATPKTVGHELALAALAHEQADVRRRGCEYLAACGDDRQANALLHLVDDHDPLVAHQAVIALGRCGPTASRERLYLLLTHTQTNMQLAAAKTLAQWHDERGAAALERFALSTSAALRRQAVEAMGELGQAEFVPALVQALDDQPGVRLAALDALPKAAGEDALATRKPPPANAADRARLWRDWYEKQR